MIRVSWMHICQVQTCDPARHAPPSANERPRAARPGQPALLRAGRDAERDRRAARGHATAGVAAAQAGPGRGDRRDPDRRLDSGREPGRRRPAAQLRARCRPPRADDRRSRGSDPPDGRPACAADVLRARCAARGDGRRSGTGRPCPRPPPPSRRPPRRSRSRSSRCAAGYWTTGPEREPYRRVADALGGQARGLMAPGLVDDAATRTGARRARRRSGDRRALGSPRRRAVRDRRPGLERRRCVGDADRARARRRGRRRRGPRRARSTSMAGSSARPCAIA